MAFYGISTNLVIYLSNKFHEGNVKSSNNVTNRVGTVWLTPLIGAYIADAHLGRYLTFLISSAVYLVGMCLVTLAASLKPLRPPSCAKGIKDIDRNKRASSFQIGIFYCALYIVAIGTGGTKPNISTMGAYQFDDFEHEEKFQKLSFFNWWIQCGATVGYGLPTAGLAVSIMVFFLGTRYYRHKTPSGSPFTRIAQVLVAAARKWKVVVPNDPKELHEPSLEEPLDKAAVKTGSSSPWTLCPITQVEEAKQMIKMLPILIATFIPSTMLAQTHTLFIKQGTTLKRGIGPKFEIPPASLTASVTISMLITIIVYDRFIVPILRKYTKNPRGITLLQRLGIGLVLHIIVMLIASFFERKRLSVAREHGITERNQIVPLPISILLPQFIFMGIADNFVEVAKLEFFYDQAPDSMKSLGTAYATTSLGVGYFLSSFLLSTVADVTKKNGHKGWILDNLNISHLDYYYAFYAVLSFINFFFFLVVARLFVYNTDINHTNKELQEAMQPALNKSILEEDKVLEE
ncbi:unnamed protein product [Withania somnifera]